jgi:hypothetical protein
LSIHGYASRYVAQPVRNLLWLRALQYEPFWRSASAFLDFLEAALCAATAGTLHAWMTVVYHPV